MERVSDEVLRMWLNARDARNVPEKIRDQVFPQINAMAQELIERRAAKQWIPVSKRLPDEGQDVLAWCGFCITAAYKKSNRLGSSTDWKTEDGVNPIFHITHWMPLPEPPA